MSRSPIQVRWTVVVRSCVRAAAASRPGRSSRRWCPSPRKAARPRARSRRIAGGGPMRGSHQGGGWRALHEHQGGRTSWSTRSSRGDPTREPPGAPEKLHDLNASSLKDFGDAIQERFLKHDLQGSRPRSRRQVAAGGRRQEFNQVLVAYVSAYVDGKYIDRFGTTLPAPAISRTVGNTEIAGVISVIIDAVGDYAGARPDLDREGRPGTLYYPASFSKDAADLALKDPKAAPLEPTVVGLRIKAARPGRRGRSPADRARAPRHRRLRHHKAKAKAIEYLGQTARAQGLDGRAGSPGAASGASGPRSARSARSRSATTRPCRW